MLESVHSFNVAKTNGVLELLVFTVQVVFFCILRWWLLFVNRYKYIMQYIMQLKNNHIRMSLFECQLDFFIVWFCFTGLPLNRPSDGFVP